MGIRFSPGCECCNSYLAVCKGVNLPLNVNNQPYYVSFGIAQGANSPVITGPFISPKIYTLLGTDLDLVNDAVGINIGANFINFNPLNLPLAINTNIQANGYGILPESFIIEPGTVRFVATIGFGLVGGFQFSFFQVSGDKGSWTALSGRTTSEIDGSPTAFYDFTVNPDGSIL